MGQPIEELDRTSVGDVAIFTLDRNLTSMATRSFDEAPAAPDTDDFAAALAGRIFAADSEVTRVYAASNAVQVTRTIRVRRNRRWRRGGRRRRDVDANFQGHG